MGHDNFNSGAGNPRGRPKGKGISSYLRDLLEIQEPVTGQPRHKLIAQKMIELALDPKISHRDFISLSDMIMDRLEGKPFQTNFNTEIVASPFEGIPMEKLEALKAKLLELEMEKPDKA